MDIIALCIKCRFLDSAKYSVINSVVILLLIPLVTQMVTPLPSRLLVAFSAPTIELRYWQFVQLQSTFWRVGQKWEISPSSLTVTNCNVFCSTPELGALAPFVFEVCGPFYTRGVCPWH